MAVSLGKVRELTGNDEQMVSLVKAATVSLQKHDSMIGHEAKVALIMDYSLSMKRLFGAGIPQLLGERALAAGTRFDDDGAIDVFVFGRGCASTGELSLTDYRGGIDRMCEASGVNRSYTYYDHAIEEVCRFYGYSLEAAEPKQPKRGLFHRHAAPAEPEPIAGVPADLPVYAIFVTDGAPSSQPAAEKAITAAARLPIFWQFMGVGDGDFSFLENLDEMDGRFVDNANFFEARDPSKLSDAELFDKMLGEYPDWVPLAKSHGLLK